MREKIFEYFDNILLEKFCVIASTQEQFNLSYEMCCAEDLNDKELDKLYQKVKEVFNGKMEKAISKFLDEKKFKEITDETWCLLMQFERATPDQLARLEQILKGAGYDC